MKTALTEVKEMLQSNVDPKVVLHWIESTGLETEKKQIVEAYNKGNIREPHRANQYFELTFTTPLNP